MDRKGFSLLEVMVALAIIAISLVVILHCHSLSIQRTNQAKDILISSLLAQKKMAEAELLEFVAIGDAQGGFDEYPGFLWQRRIYNTPVEDFKKVVLLILWDEGENKRSTELVSFIAKMR